MPTVSSTVSYGFEFEIGDVVRHKAAPPAGSFSGLQRMVVIGRLVEQCHGGVQGHYQVRCVEENGAVTNVLTLSAPEVAAYPTEEEVADRKAAQKAREAELAEAARVRRAAIRAQEAEATP